MPARPRTRAPHRSRHALSAQSRVRGTSAVAPCAVLLATLASRDQFVCLRRSGRKSGAFFSCFAPADVYPDARFFVLDISAFSSVSKERFIAAARARGLQEAGSRGRLRIPDKGVSIFLDLPRDAFEVQDGQVEAAFEWDGASGSTQFTIACLRSAELRRHACKAIIRINGEEKAILRFTLNVVAKNMSSPPSSPPSEVEVELELVFSSIQLRQFTDRQPPPEPAGGASAPHGGWAHQSERAKSLQREIEACMLKGLPQDGIPLGSVVGWVGGCDAMKRSGGSGADLEPMVEMQARRSSHRLSTQFVGLSQVDNRTPVVYNFRCVTAHRLVLVHVCFPISCSFPRPCQGPACYHRLEIQTDCSAAGVEGDVHVLREWNGQRSELSTQHTGLPGAPRFPARIRSFWSRGESETQGTRQAEAIQLFYAKVLRCATLNDTERLKLPALHAGLGLSGTSAKRLVAFACHRAEELKSLASCEPGMKYLRALRPDEFEHCRDIHFRRSSFPRDVFGGLLLEDLESRDDVEVLSKRIDALKLASHDGQAHALLTVDHASPGGSGAARPEPEWCLGVLVRGLVWSRSLHLPAF